MSVLFNEAPLSRDKTLPHFSRFHPFGLGVADHFPMENVVGSLNPPTGALLCVNYLRTRVAQKQSSLFVNTPSMCHHSP